MEHLVVNHRKAHKHNTFLCVRALNDGYEMRLRAQTIVIRLKCGRSFTMHEKCLRIRKLSKKPLDCVRFFVWGFLARATHWNHIKNEAAFHCRTHCPFSSGQFTYARSQWMQNIKKNIIISRHSRVDTQKCKMSKYILKATQGILPLYTLFYSLKISLETFAVVVVFIYTILMGNPFSSISPWFCLFLFIIIHFSHLSASVIIRWMQKRLQIPTTDFILLIFFISVDGVNLIKFISKLKDNTQNGHCFHWAFHRSMIFIIVLF